ncbi:hypothetical protein ABT269_34740 [Streptomyces viridosporus]|uniref:hypothetical protein n=1 Tax=Streptomyces viridosporus TaxID=67581 RepID=UPI003329E17B
MPYRLDLLQEARAQLAAGSRPTAARLDAAGMDALPAAQAQQPALIRDLASHAKQTARRLANVPYASSGRMRELAAAQCALYRAGSHRVLGDVDAALELAALSTPERRARAATNTARALLAAGDAAGAFAYR